MRRRGRRCATDLARRKGTAVDVVELPIAGGATAARRRLRDEALDLDERRAAQLEGVSKSGDEEEGGGNAPLDRTFQPLQHALLRRDIEREVEVE